MNETEQSSTPTVNENGVNGVTEAESPTSADIVVPIENDEGPTVIEGQPVTVTNDEVDDPPPIALTQRQVRDVADDIADAMTDVDMQVTIPDEPDFDKLHAATRFLVGVAIEGTNEFTQRLQLWQDYLREEMPEISSDLSDASEQDLLRYAVIGFIFESEDSGRSILKKLLKVPGGVARTAVRPTKSLANSRLTGPFRRRIDRMADRGEDRLMRWIQRGYDEEPISRNLARLGVQEITDEFINLLAENEEVKSLVQEQSMGLAGEAVDQVRERTFSADTLVERIARAVTRRNPRLEPPMADLSDFHQDATTSGEKDDA